MSIDSQARIAAFFASYPTRTYPKDQIMIFSGENPEKIYYIVSGRVCMYDITYRGDEIITNLYKNPAFFPLSLALNGATNQFFYKAETETVVHYAPPKDVIKFLYDNPTVLIDLLKRVYSGVDGLMGRVVQLMAGTARTRLIYELVIETLRFGLPVGDGKYALDIHEKHIAARSGLSRETVSRGMKRLKESDLITIQPSGITVNNLAGLQQLLGTPETVH